MKLKEYEVVCNKCLGQGNLKKGDQYSPCPKCLGEGKLDWVENVVGKRRKELDEIITLLIHLRK